VDVGAANVGVYCVGVADVGACVEAALVQVRVRVSLNYLELEFD